MERLLIFFWIASAFPMFLFAQSEAQKAKIEQLLAKAESYSYVNLDSALYYIQLGQKEAESPHNQQFVFKVLRGKGMVLEDNNQLLSAVEAYRNALTIAEQYLDDKSKMAIYNDWAIIHKKIKAYHITEEYHSKTIALAQKTQQWEMAEMGYHGLGTMYSMLSNFPQAIASYRRSIEIAEKQGNKEGVLVSMQNIGNVYLKAKNYDSAREYIQKAYDSACELNDSLRMANTLKIAGTIELETNNFDKALEKFQIARYFFSLKNKKERIAETLLLIGDTYFKQKKYPLANENYTACAALKTYFQPYTSANFYQKIAKLHLAKGEKKAALWSLEKGLEFADTLKFKEIACENHQLLATIYQQKGNFSRAYEHLYIANILQKRLEIDNNQRDIAQMELRYAMEKQQTEIQQQQRALHTSRIIRWVLGLSALGLAISLIVTWRQLKAKKKAVEYAELLLKELHHRVKNNLQNIISITRLQSRNIADPMALNIIKDSQSRLEAISTLHQQFYQNDDLESVDFKYFLEELMQNILFKNDIEGKLIMTKIEVEENNITIDNSLPIALIINELISNSIKYAFANTTHPQLKISIKNHSLHYADNGKSYDTHFMEKGNFGMEIITAFAAQLDAKYRFYNDNGANFEMNF